MDKLEVGMYVKTELYNISRILDTEEDNEWLELDKNKGYLIHKDTILKASHNIIDLIEVGDYVNGYKVSFKDKDLEPFVQCDYPVQEGTTNHYRFYEKAIETIVTKEQFSNMEYRIGD